MKSKQTFISEVTAWHFHHAAKLADDAGAHLAADVCRILANADSTKQRAARDAGVMNALKSNDVDLLANWLANQRAAK